MHYQYLVSPHFYLIKLLYPKKHVKAFLKYIALYQFVSESFFYTFDKNATFLNSFWIKQIYRKFLAKYEA